MSAYVISCEVMLKAIFSCASSVACLAAMSASADRVAFTPFSSSSVTSARIWAVVTLRGKYMQGAENESTPPLLSGAKSEFSKQSSSSSADAPVNVLFWTRWKT